MKRIILLFVLINIILFAWAHPKFTKVSPNSIPVQHSRADSLHGFDVIAYDIWINIDDQNQSISGAVNAFVNAEENLTSISYELEGLTVDSVYVNNNITSFTHNNGVIDIDINVSNGESFTTRVVYHGNPILSNDGYANGMTFRPTQIFTISDPNAGRYWWPSYDHPWDKAIVDLHIRVRSDWKVAANGIREEIEQHTDNTSTHHWIGSNPMATYLVSIACAPYEEIMGTFQDIPLHNFAFASQVPTAQVLFAKLPQMMQAFTDAYGQYPFEKYGNAVANISTFGAMEHQTMTTLGSTIMEGTLSNEYVIAHELSHQWFGNCLTPLTWKDVWLSESFATYSEVIYTEAVFDNEAANIYVRDKLHNYYLNFANQNGDRVIYDPIYSEYFYPMVYEKGASVLHMLRAWVGDDVFFDILQTYFQSYQNKNVVTAEFKEIAEQLSGLNLDQFFDQWIFKKGIPELDYIVLKSPDNTSIRTIARTTSNEENNQFYLKSPLHLESNNQINSILVDASPQGEITTFDNHDIIINYAFDPDNWMLTRANTEHFVELNSAFATSASVTLNWAALDEWISIDGYNIYRSTNEDDNFVRINEQAITELFYIDNTVTNGQEYFYKIVACLDEYETEFSNSMSAKPLEFPLNQGLLIVDETSDGNGNTLNPTDNDVDEFYNSIINSDFTSWDVAEQGLPTAESLRHYSMVIWHDDDITTSLIDDDTQQYLAAYILSGGKLILSGWRTANSITNPYLVDILQSSGNTLVNTVTFSSAVSPNLPELVPDGDKLNANWNGNMPSICVFPNATSVMYRAQFTNNSNWHNTPVIISGQNIIVSGLPFYYMQEDTANQLFNMILDDWSVDTEDVIKPESQLKVDIYPNPANLNQSISFDIKNDESNKVKIAIYNIRGQLVQQQIIPAQKNQKLYWDWDKTDKTRQKIASGIYFVNVKSEQTQIVKKVIIIK